MASEPLSHLETPVLADRTFAVTSGRMNDTDGHNGWNKIIDELLATWRQRPELLEDDGIDAPSSAAITAVSHAARRLRDQGSPAPTSISPTGDGGIALHYEHNDTLFTIEFSVDGCREIRFHFGGELVRLGSSAEN